MQAATEYSFLVTKSLEIVQKSIILRSKSLIDVIKITTKVCLEKINNKAKVVKNFYKSNETGITQETFYESKKNFFNSFNLSKFIKDLNKSLSNFEDQEVNTDDKFTNVLRSFKVFDDNFEAESKNIDYEINLLKEKWKINFKLFCKKSFGKLFAQESKVNKNRRSQEIVGTKIVEKKSPQIKKNKYDDWVCAKCSYSNIYIYELCSKCLDWKINQKNVDTDKKEWICKKCNWIHSWVSQYCKKCFKNPEFVRVAEIKSAEKKWNCRSCNVENVATSKVCLNCKKPRRASSSAVWVCKACKTKNELIRNNCTNCKLAKFTEKTDTWECKSCNSFNCLFCKTELKSVDCPNCDRGTRYSDSCSYCKQSLRTVKICSTCNLEIKRQKKIEREVNSSLSSTKYGQNSSGML